MDDRDFIYWLKGIFQFGTFDTLKPDQVDQIMENIMEVYDSVQNQGVMNDFDSMRIIAFIEGALLYYDDAPLEHRVKTTTLIKNEVMEVYHKFRDDDPSARLPLFKQPAKYDDLFGYGQDMKMDIIPLTPEMMDEFERRGVPKIDLSKDQTLSLIDSISDILGLKSSPKKEEPESNALPSKQEKASAPEESEPEKDPDTVKESLMDTLSGAMDDLFGDSVSDSQPEDVATSSLDAIADKIASRA